MERHARASYSAHERHQRYFLRYRCRRTDRSLGCRAERHVLGVEDSWVYRFGPCLREHLRWFPRHRPHARHVQEEREAMRADIAALAYLASGVLFILALRGLSSPETSRTGNTRGMVGTALAIVTTLWIARVTDPLTWGLIVAGIALGGGIGEVV